MQRIIWNPTIFGRMRIILTLLTLLLVANTCLLAQGNVNQTDAEGRKQGKWMKKYPNDKLRYEGQFVDDLPVGLFTYYFEEGGKSAEIQYLAEGAGAEATFFHKNGTVMGRGLYSNQQKEGEWKFYDNKNILSSIDEYKGGKLHGKSQVFYINGDLSAEYVYVDGILNGPFKEYFLENKVSVEGSFEKDEFVGSYTAYFETGDVKEKGQYVRGKKDGHWVYYAPDGNIIAQEVYDKGTLEKQKVEEAFEKSTLIPMEIAPEDVIDESELDPSKGTWDGQN